MCCQFIEDGPAVRIPCPPAARPIVAPRIWDNTVPPQPRRLMQTTSLQPGGPSSSPSSPEDESPSSPEDENDTNGSAHLDHDALPGRTKICNDRDERAAKAGSGLPAARRWPTMSNQMGRRGGDEIRPFAYWRRRARSSRRAARLDGHRHRRRQDQRGRANASTISDVASQREADREGSSARTPLRYVEREKDFYGERQPLPRPHSI